MAGIGAPLWFAFRGDQLLVLDDGNPVGVPRMASPEDLGSSVAFEQEIGVLDELPCFAADLAPDAEAPEGMLFRDLRGLWGVDEDFFLMAGRARQIVDWNRTHRFCGRCGAKTEFGSEPLAKKCPRCGMIFYPRLSPAAIVLIRHGERILLARSPGFPPGMYSVLAGFVEPGESIEETISREIREEVGVEVGNLRYFGSQPWPFPNSLMIAFVAEYVGGELRTDPEEIEDAGWYPIGGLPSLPPGVSIARRMIDAFVAEHGGGKTFEAPE